MDIVDFYPNTKVSDGEITIAANVAPTLRDICLTFSRIIHDNLYITTPLGCYKVPGVYGIGLVHSGEVCDLQWASVEERAFNSLLQRGIAPTFVARMIDDYFLVLEGSEHSKAQVVSQLQMADPDRPLPRWLILIDLSRSIAAIDRSTTSISL